LLGLLNIPLSAAENDRAEVNRQIDELIDDHDTVKKYRIKFYENGELKSKLGNTGLEINEELVRSLDNETYTIQRLMFEDGFRESIVTSVKNEDIISIRLIESQEEYVFALEESDVRRMKQMVETSLRETREKANLEAKRRLERNGSLSSIAEKIILGQNKQLFNRASGGDEDEDGLGGDADAVAVSSKQPPEAQAFAIAPGLPSNPSAMQRYDRR